MNLQRDYARREDETDSQYKKRIQLEHEIDHRYGISPQQRRDRAQQTDFDDSHIIRILPYVILFVTALTAMLISYFGGTGNEVIIKHLWSQWICAIISTIIYYRSDSILANYSRISRAFFGGSFALITYVFVAAIATDIFSQLKN